MAKAREIEVKRAHAIKNGVVAIDLVINDVFIYGCFFRRGFKDDKVWRLVSFPQYKRGDKYYDHAWVGLTKDDLLAIELQINELLHVGE